MNEISCLLFAQFQQRVGRSFGILPGAWDKRLSLVGYEIQEVSSVGIVESLCLGK